MFTIDMKVNGKLVKRVKVRNIGRPKQDDSLPDDFYLYEINNNPDLIVGHCRDNGIAFLAERVLEVINSGCKKNYPIGVRKIEVQDDAKRNQRKAGGF